MSIPNSLNANWQELYEAVLQETDKEKLTALVDQFEVALTQRGQELAHAPEHLEERNAMARAAENLLLIKTEKLSWSPISLK
jgi:hypothetical protein